MTIINTLVKEHEKNKKDIVGINLQLDEKANLINWELQNKIRTNKPIFTIIDDDGHMAVKEKLVPLANKYNFKFTSAIIGSWVEDSDPRHMRVNDIKDLYNMGHEIASHSYGHIHMDTTTESELKSDFERMGKFIKSMGINYSNLVYPFGARNDSAINVVRNYVRGARTTAYGINYAPIQTWDLRVINGSTTDYDTLSTDKERVQYLKNELDKAYQNKGWAIYASHIYMDGNNHEYIIEELVKYAQSLGMEIVTFNEGLNRFGNIIDIGRYFDYDVDSREYYVLGVNSEVRSSFNNVPLRRVADVSNSTPPNYFKLGDVYIRRVTYANKTGFPEKEGVLTVDLAGAIAYNQYATQTYEPVGTGRIYKRYALDSNAWSEWELITPMKVITGVTSSSAVTQFPNNTVSIFRVSYANRNGFPGNTSGILTTQRLFEDSYASQEYKQTNNNDIYRRYWQVETNTWSEWQLSVPITSLSSSSMEITANSLLTAFPVGRISYTPVLYSNRTGFPTSQGGTLTTYRIIATDGYAYQDYEPVGTCEKHRRYWKADTTAWSEWTKVSAI